MHASREFHRFVDREREREKEKERDSSSGISIAGTTRAQQLRKVKNAGTKIPNFRPLQVFSRRGTSVLSLKREREREREMKLHRCVHIMPGRFSGTTRNFCRPSRPILSPFLPPLFSPATRAKFSPPFFHPAFLLSFLPSFLAHVSLLVPFFSLPPSKGQTLLT